MWEQKYTVRQVADQLLLSPHSVYALLRRNELHGVRAGRAWRIESSAIRAYLHGDHGQSARIVARQIRLVHFTEATPESVCLAFPDGSQVKLTMRDARNLVQSPELAHRRGYQLDSQHFLTNQAAMDLMISLVAFFAKAAPGGVARIFNTRWVKTDPVTKE